MVKHQLQATCLRCVYWDPKEVFQLFAYRGDKYVPEKTWAQVDTEMKELNLCIKC